jgi:HEAT repeat protein
VDDRSGEVNRLVPRLTDANEQIRADVVMQLGRLRSDRAVDPLAATLSGDGSPTVREAAARALGLTGSTRAIPALQRAALSDASAQVRSSAQFSVEVLQTH